MWFTLWLSCPPNKVPEGKYFLEKGQAQVETSNLQGTSPHAPLHPPPNNVQIGLRESKL